MILVNTAQSFINNNVIISNDFPFNFFKNRIKRKTHNDVLVFADQMRLSCSSIIGYDRSFKTMPCMDDSLALKCQVMTICKIKANNVSFIAIFFPSSGGSYFKHYDRTIYKNLEINFYLRRVGPIVR